MVAGNDATLVATIAPSNATNKTVNWSSSNTAVATVDNTGKVTAVAAGAATITATSAANSDAKASCAVTVEASGVSVTGISLDQTTLTLESGKNATITATIAPSNATNKAVTWTTSDPTVATVDNTGKVTATGAGTATITATSSENSDIKAACAVTVTGPVHVHTYEAPTWTWSNDYSMAVATFNCTAGDDTQNITDLKPVATEVSAATCTADQVMRYVAKVTFNGSDYANVVDDVTIANTALGHDWGDWVVTKPATEKEEGVQTRTCSRCKETETKAIPKLEPATTPTSEESSTESGKNEKPPVSGEQPTTEEMAKAPVDYSLPVINPEKIKTTASMSAKTMTIKLGKINADNCLVEYRQASEKTWKSQWYGKGASQLVIQGMKKNGFYQYRFTTVKLVNRQWKKGQTSNTCYRWIKNIKAKKPVAGKKRFTFKWTKVKKAKGYEIQYATNKAFTKNAKKVTVKGAKKTSKTIKGLKKGKTYYVRIRPYATKGGKKYLGIYTVAKKVKVK
jgi:hypothetical protein